MLLSLVLQPHFAAKWDVTQVETAFWLLRWGISVENRAPMDGRKAQSGYLRL